ncbi:hypothetical protein PHIN8_03010 [Polynucleobacter sp. HIN8]|uniref:SIS domain-containing protein n=1 Tax=Polynucleobacter sp. HIN8 TaxID=3047867 RepID=UPI002572DBB8|nr:SIS domain-containing protein [Polynucleobacter sp. HIN8]BEI38357.1 hypothetical protein PHIN8_03010 [Polynucleobacter sp. HIN8]
MNLELNNRLDNFCTLINTCEITLKNESCVNLNNGINLIYEKLKNLKNNNKNLYLFGNGGSASVASHAATDFCNVAKIKATTLHESSMLTCFSNDYGYENSFSNIVDHFLNKEDIIIAISSSGNSMNIRNLVLVAEKNDALLITFSGFSINNPLRKLGDINIWLNSNDYGFVEIGHQFILHNIADRFNPKFSE